MKISTIIVAKNAEELISDCLDSVSFSNQVLVVDNDSKDRTVEIAEKKKAKVIGIESTDFSEIRNFGLKNADGSLILYLDTDERVSRSLKEEILKIAEEGSPKAAYSIPRKNFYFGNHEWPYVEKIERLFKKDNLRGWKGKIHESPIVDGKVGELKNPILHYTHRDLSSMVKKTLEWSKIEAELRFKSNHPKMTWWRFPRVMLTGFIDSYYRQKGYKAGTVGIIESMYQGFSILVTYARLWELQQKNEKI